MNDSRLVLCLLTSALISTAAVAQESVNPYEQLEREGRPAVRAMDLGVSGGFNNPGGVIGVEGEYRLNDFLSVGAAAGIGAWGVRLTPQVRLYPLGASQRGTPIFLEAGLGLNFGGNAKLTENGVETRIRQALTSTANISMGLRKDIWESSFVVFRVGYAASLKKTGNYTVANGGTLSPGGELLLNAMQPGGLIIGAAFGWSFF